MEYLDLYKKDGTYAGSYLRGDSIPEGHYIHLVTVFTMNHAGEILLTKRAQGKSYAGKWETTAGAVQAGESILHGAMRELHEETGIEAAPEEMISLGYMETTNRNSYMHAYFVQKDVSLDNIVLQPRETDEAKWVPLDWGLVTDPSLAKPVQMRFLYFWQQLDSFRNPVRHKDENLETFNRFEPWLDWASQLQFYAQQGQAYAKNGFDKERYDGVSRIASEMLAYKTGIDTQKVLSLFAPSQKVYRTPNIEVRAAVFRNGKLLMVKEKHPEKWALPGGWCDPGLSLAENAAKEVWEESGLRVRATRVVSVEDRRKEDYYFVMPFEIYKIYVICEEITPASAETSEEDTEFSENLETSGYAFFNREEIAHLELSSARVTARSLAMCFDAAQDPNWQTYLD